MQDFAHQQYGFLEGLAGLGVEEVHRTFRQGQRGSQRQVRCSWGVDAKVSVHHDRQDGTQDCCSLGFRVYRV